MGEEEQANLMDDLVQENEALREQIMFLKDYNEDLSKYLSKSVTQVYQDARLLLMIPREVVKEARDKIALQDGERLLRGLDDSK